MSFHPVFIRIGGDPAKRDEETALVQQAISLKEKQLGRPLTSTEILQTFGEVIEPDESKRLFLSSRGPREVREPRR